jgi:hypothetical protein
MSFTIHVNSYNSLDCLIRTNNRIFFQKKKNYNQKVKFLPKAE